MSHYNHNKLIQFTIQNDRESQIQEITIERLGQFTSD